MNRQQFVAVEGSESSCLHVLSRVPQGSVLGPLLFITYVNDVTEVDSPQSILTRYISIKKLYRVRVIDLQKDINAVSSLMQSKLLQFSMSQSAK